MGLLKYKPSNGGLIGFDQKEAVMGDGELEYPYEKPTKLPTGEFLLATDGSIYPNPSPYGGWAYLIRYGEEVLENYGYSEDGVQTTNNEMEILPMLCGLRHIMALCDNQVDRVKVKIQSDSNFIIRLLREGWSCRNKRVEEYQAEFYEIERYFRSIYFEKIKGHNGQVDNERVNTLAEMGRLENPRLPEHLRRNPYS